LSINPKDNLALPKNKLTFDQMLESAIQNEKGSGAKSARGGAAKSGSQAFLKKKDRYDPRKSISNLKGVISEKNINKKRVFKSNDREDDSDASQDEGLYSDGAQSESKGTFKNFPRKSFIQLETEPLISNRTVVPPTLLQKLYEQQVKTQMFLRTDTGR